MKIIRIFFIITFFYVYANACAGGFWDDDHEFIFLDKREYPFSNITENLNSSKTYNEIVFYSYKKRVKKANLQEWSDEFPQYSKEEIEKFLYKKKDLKFLKNKELKEYINFLIKQNFYVQTGNYWYYPRTKKKDIVKVDLLISLAENRIASIKSSYLKLRYFYLALRLAHYENKNPLKLYNKYKYLLDNDKNTIVKDWIQGLYSGALIKNKKIVEGVYQFTTLFSPEKINWHLSFYNFKYITTNEQWEQLLNLAKSKEEKIKFYTLRALNKNAKVIEELKNIAKIDKDSKFFDMLLFRELLKSQDKFTLYKKTPYAKKVNKDYTEFIKYLQTVKKEDMYLINLSLSYFYVYKNDMKKAKEYLFKLTKNNVHKSEIKTLEYVIYLNELQSIDKQKEDEIYTKMIAFKDTSVNYKYIHNYTISKALELYKKQKNEFKQYLFENINYFNIDTLTLDIYNKLDAFFAQKDKTKLEKHITKKIKNQTSKKTLERVHIKLLINNMMFKEALNTKGEFLNTFVKFNIFNGSIKGNNRVGTTTKSTVKQSLNKLILIRKKLEEDENLPIENYLFANAIYNLSFFGNSSALTSIYVSSYYFKNLPLEKRKIELTINHYKKALENSKKDEFKAKVLYLLAKSELSLFDLNSAKSFSSYSPESYNFQRVWYGKKKEYKRYIKEGYGEFFDKLNKEYSNTKYYKELIQECANLSFYNSLK